MRIPILLLTITLILTVGVDAYIYIVAKKRCRSSIPARIQLWSALALYALLLVGLFMPTRSGQPGELVVKMWILFSYITFFCSKLTFVIVDCLGYIPRLFRKSRLKFMGLIGGILALILFLTMWWGALINRFNINPVKVDVEIENLPEAFDGYRIAQISDLHVGTFGTDTDFVDDLVEYVNALDVDAVCFTGDIVNRNTDEIVPFISSLKRLDAHDGVFSILGNHDYGDYYNWNSLEEKRLSVDKLVDIQKGMGWKILLNEHQFIKHGHDSIAIIGVENVGDPPFTVYGDLSESYPMLNDSVTKILLTHNPAHWDMEIADNDNNNIALTLSGHTHAMQIELFGWSPAAYRYHNWGGIYSDKSGKRRLYVNIGDGTVGMPMRLGATPEVTIITLRKAQ